MMMRRRMMESKKSEWDYVLVPEDGAEVGTIPYLKIQVKTGEKFEVNYFITSATGYVYDGRGCGLQYLFPYQNSSQNKDTTITVGPVAKDGTLAFAGHWNSGQQYPGDIPTGKYIKIKKLT